VPCNEDQKERGNELRKPDQTEIERAAGQRIDLPPDADCKHLVRNHRGDARKPEQDERTMRDERARLDRRSSSNLDVNVPSSWASGAPSRGAAATACVAPQASTRRAVRSCPDSRESRRLYPWP